MFLKSNNIFKLNRFYKSQSGWKYCKTLIEYNMENSIKYDVNELLDLAEVYFNEYWYDLVMNDIKEKCIEDKLYLKRISVNFNFSDKDENNIVEKIAIEVPNINIYLELYLSQQLIGYFSYFLDLEFNFLDEFIYYNLE